MDTRQNAFGRRDKASAMERLSRYSTQPNIGAEPGKSTSSMSVGHPTTVSSKINTPLSRTRPEYVITRESSNPGVQGKLCLNQTSPGKRPKDKLSLDANNNNNTISSSDIQTEERSSGGFSDPPVVWNRSSAKRESLKEKVVNCICNRPKAHILCTICGYSTFGHIRQPCYAHLRVTYLLALACCPRCNSGRLMEVTPLKPSP